MNAARVLDGRREGELLTFPSVRRMAEILAQRCREESWVRTSVASLERFRVMTGSHDLEALREQAIAEPAVAEQALASFASALAGYTESQVSALAMGAKIWFRLNGVAVPWRPLPGIPSRPSLATSDQQGEDRVILLALIGSGLRFAELLRLRLGNVGSLNNEARLIPDIEADPLAVQHTPRLGKQRERITFLSYHARQALLASLEQRAATGEPLDLEAPLIVQRNGSNATSSSVTRAKQRSRALIRAGSDVNVALCRATGDFFRSWGLPGSRFSGPEELNIEEYT
jgi:integrase